MENKDHLKEIFCNIDQINEPIDLEAVILKSIKEQERVRSQITRYKINGIRALSVSVVLVIVLAILYSLPNSVQSFEYSSIKYISIILTLLVLFVQLEMGGTKLFNNLKNNLL